MKLAYLLLSLLVFMSCNKSSQEQDATQKVTKTEYQLSKQDIEAIDYIDYDLSSTAKKATENWKNYTELQNLITSIKDTDLSYFQTDKEIHVSLFNDLISSIPDRIQSQPIEARIKTLQTKFFKFRSAVTLTTTTKQELTAVIKEFFISFSNLNLQINKKLEKESQDVSKPRL